MSLLQKIVRWLAALAFVTTAVSIPIFGVPLNLAQLIAVILFFLFLAFRRLFFHLQVTLFLGVYLFISLIIAYFNDFSYQNILVSYLGLNLYAGVLNSVFKIHEGDIGKLIKMYINVAAFAAGLSIIQEISYLNNYVAGYDFQWLFNGYAQFTFSGPFLKAPSIFTEPGYFAPFLIPASYLGLKSLIFDSGEVGKIKALVIITGLILTFSFIGYFGFLVSIIILLRRNIVIGVGVAVLFAFYIALNSNSIVSRVDGIVDFFSGDYSISSNFSALVTILNYNLTIESFLIRPFFGAGIDGYEMMSQKIISAGFDSPVLNQLLKIASLDILMVKEGGNLFFRLLVEFGLVGVIGILVYLFVKLSSTNSTRHIQFVCLIFLLTFGIRTGQYLRFEVWFFLMLYLKIKDDDVLV